MSSIMRIWLITMLMPLCYTLYSQDKVNFGRESSYSPMVMSLNDLNDIIEEINYYIPPDTSTDRFTELLRSRIIIISKPNKSLTYEKFVDVPETVTDKEDFTSLKIEYRDSYKPISSIQIDFMDYERKLRISGNDQRKVEALFYSLDKKFTSYTTLFGSVNLSLPFILVSVLFIAFFGSALYGAFSMPDKPRSVVTFLWVGTPIFLIILWFGGNLLSGDFFDSWFPGFVLKSEVTSWIDRNANNMEFVGFVALVGSGISYLIKKLSKKKLPSAELTPETKENSDTE